MKATDLSAKPQLSFAISYGFLGRPAHGKQISRLLRHEGYIPAPDIASADIVLAHSAGCWLINDMTQAKLVIYVGMPLAQDRPRQTFRRASSRNIHTFISNRHFLSVLKIGLYSLYYGLRQPVRNLEIVKAVKNAQFNINPDTCTVFIANRHDPWPQSVRLQQYLKKQDWAFVSLPGSHDNVWEHPERYVAIINHYARLLA